jgi:hypothetical protein
MVAAVDGGSGVPLITLLGRGIPDQGVKNSAPIVETNIRKG